MLDWPPVVEVLKGVRPPLWGRRGVEEPEAAWEGIIEASFLAASASICFRDLLRRWEGFQEGFRKGFEKACMSSWSRRAWWLCSSELVVIGAMVGGYGEVLML